MGSAPLSVLLSQVLVAYAIEYDNAFEVRMAKTWARPFKVSIVMWSNFMRFVRDDGTRVADIAASSCVPQSAVASVVGGMERWGYITVDHDSSAGPPPLRKGFGSARGIKADTVIRPSMVGKLAVELWDGLAAEIEQRWRTRLGEARVTALRDALRSAESDIEVAMPRFLPIVGGGGLFAHSDLEARRSEPDDELPALLSRVLLAFTLDYERLSEVSLAVGANVLRVLDEHGVSVKDVPLSAGVSKEAVATSMTWLEEAALITVESDPHARGKVARVTTKGVEARKEYGRHLGEVEKEWEGRLGKDRVGALRGSLEAILDEPGGENGPLAAGLVPPPGCWRGAGRYKQPIAAFVASPRDGLPHHPMVLHRGGWPDGS